MIPMQSSNFSIKSSDANHFDLTTSEWIQRLTDGLLTKTNWEQIDSLSYDLLSTEGKRETAIQFLQNIFGTTPKRPLYYLDMDIEGLPEKTRYVVENAGHFVDVLIKHCSHQLGKFHVLAMHASLGSNIKRLRKVLPDALLQNLNLFNDLFYIPAKHEWDVGDRPHLFSVKETIICLFIARHLADQILNTSAEARIWTKSQ